MASPHVAGAAAMILAANPTFTPQQVQDLLVSRAVTGAIENPGLRSPNKLLQIEASTPSFAPLTVRLRAHANNLVVNADGSGSTLIANRLVNGAWEEFDVFDAGDGLVSLRSHANGRYVSADLNIGGKLINNRTAVGFWEKFTLSTNADGSVSLKANSNKKFVTAENFGNAPLVANRDSIGYWEQFDVAVASSQIVITSWINPKRPVATSADLSKGAKLIANRTEIGPWEVFDVADLGGGQVALRAHANNMVVTADLNNGGTLTANRTVVGPWEKFQIVYDAPTNDPPLRSVNLKANANGKFVSTDFNLGGTLIANRGAASFWESVVILAD